MVDKSLDNLGEEFEKADIILSDALVAFQKQGVSQYVFGMALMEIGVAALVKLDEPDAAIIDAVKELMAKARSFQDTAFPIPREQ